MMWRMTDLTASTSCACPMYRIIEKLGKKWMLLILRAFTEKKRLRFSEIEAALPEINARILSERLSEMEEEGLIVRMVEDAKPVACYYEITEKGMDLRTIFSGVVAWSKKWERCPAMKTA